MFWLLTFAFCLGFGTTIAEPALTAVAAEAAEVAAEGGVIPNSLDEREQYADGLRFTVALSVGIAILLGVLRILKGWPIQYMIIGGYIGVVVLTAFRPGKHYWDCVRLWRCHNIDDHRSVSDRIRGGFSLGD